MISVKYTLRKQKHNSVLLVLRGCVRDFQAGSGSTPTDFFKMLMKECVEKNLYNWPMV